MPKLPGYMQIIVYHNDIYIKGFIVKLHTHDWRVYLGFILLFCLACCVQICNQFDILIHSPPSFLLLATLDTLPIGKFSCCVVSWSVSICIYCGPLFLFVPFFLPFCYGRWRLRVPLKMHLTTRWYPQVDALHIQFSYRCCIFNSPRIHRQYCSAQAHYRGWDREKKNANLAAF